MGSYKRYLVLPVLGLAAVFCSLADFSGPTDAGATLTAQAPALQTEVALQLTQAAGSSVTQIPSKLTGSIVGSLSYPADALPPMRVAAFDILNGQPYFVDTVMNQPEYEIPNMPPGEYYVVAYSLGGGAFPFGLAGAYTVAVPCGLTEDCNSHKLLPVVVAAGQATANIRPADWNARDLPVMPGSAPETPIAPTAASGGGSIQGSLSYPSEFIPALVVAAFRADAPDSPPYYVLTQQGQETYTLPVPAGQYLVVAYIVGGGYSGGYSQMVPCGLQATCTDHSLITVNVAEGATATGIDPVDWYAPLSAFPEYPLP